MKEDFKFLFKPSELFIIYSLARSQKSIPGDYAEVGVYKGSSAKVMCEIKGDKPLHLFDTFEGIPEIDKKMDARFSKKMFASTYEYTKKRLATYKNVYIYKGLFPESGKPIKDKKFALVHLDVDVYESTKNSLEFFYDKMEPYGIILIHDYAQAEGVKRAVNEFFIDKPEAIIEMSLTQCMIIKK